MLTAARNLVFEKIHNLRDIGGLPTRDGRRMKAGILYRSDELSAISKNDLTVLEELDLKMVCDLRTVNERKSRPDRIPPHWEIKEIHVPIHHGSQDMSTFDLFRTLNGNTDSLDFAKIIHDFYRCLVEERKEQVRQIFELVDEEDNIPALIHCTGGKDRTGYIAALFQLLAGVEYETVVSQYLLSNERIAGKMKKTERYLRLLSLYRIPSEKFKPMLAVDRKHLDFVIGQIRKDYGTIETYLNKGCGLKLSKIKKIKMMLVE
ncbi:tyrosine-protein phosphatase [Bacillus sp. EB01]|uniref:tyrosine-protein phosphatase n=1 Tax=Bacillus sp. EB01 TaxID=1347086 RepID=UPI0005C51CB9|nr:tyrosine-protein phosphatase [Bacillus sp. EB01]